MKQGRSRELVFEEGVPFLSVRQGENTATLSSHFEKEMFLSKS